MEKILVSACLIGEKVRYDGDCQSFRHQVLQQWLEQGRIISICPEVVGGLPIPREPAEIQQNNGQVITQQGKDVTHSFLQGARAALAVCQKYQIQYALLKESSPSCGSHTIYDGSFQKKKIQGKGLTAQLLAENDIKVYSEKNIEELIDQLT